MGDRFLNQSSDILRYVSKLAGLYPDDPLKALEVDSMVSSIDEVFTKNIGKTIHMKAEKEEIMKVRQEMLDLKDGNVGVAFGKLDKMIGNGKSGFLFDWGITAADLQLFQNVCHLSMGILDGIPKTYITSNFKNLEQFRLRVASIPEIGARFTDGDNPYKDSPYTVHWSAEEEKTE